MTIKDEKADFIETARTIGSQTLLQGDCVAVMQKLAEASVDTVVTSPPYNLGIRYGTYDDGEGRDAYLAWLSDVASALARVLSPAGSIFLNVGGSLKDPMIPYQVLEVFLGHFRLQNNIIWSKSLYVEPAGRSFGHFKPINSPRFLNHNFEHVFHLSHRGDVRIERLAIGVPFEDRSNIARFGHAEDRRCRGNVWQIPYKTVTSRQKAKGGHPAVFPVELPRMCLELAGLTGSAGPARVLDPFVGSGSTLVAAEQLGLPGMGIDVDAAYLDFAAARLAGQ